ncbi:MAG: allantoinase AllB [Bryobacteraceae bacterium]|nr:allantoinase AllB [Bryobacteraceae bacterium]
MFELAIRGGTLVTPSGLLEADIAIADGRVAAIGSEAGRARSEIDARGLHVFPGVIDSHVHFNEPGRTEWEGALTGSHALAAGGGTLFCDMPLNSTPCTTNRTEFVRKHEALAQSAITDFALWGGLIPGNLAELAGLAEVGVMGFKAFMSNSGLPEFPHADDLTLLEGMAEAARLGLPVAVHAENDALTQDLSVRALREGRTGVRDFLTARPVIAEVEAISRATRFAEETGARLHIVHISSGRGVAVAAEARARGVDVTMETCPHYLFFTVEDVERIGVAAKCAPPIRDAAEREALWTALLDGTLDLVASDHSPAAPEHKTGDFFRAWGGIAGVQSTLAVLLNGHFERGLSLLRIAQLLSSKPAERYRLPGKGSLALGYDADLALVDLSATHRLRHLHQRHAMSPYLDSAFRGVVRRTLRRGETIFEDGRVTARTPGRLVAPCTT